MDYQLKPVAFPSARRILKSPVAASVRKSQPHAVTFRIDAATAQKMGLRPDTYLTPFLDKGKRIIGLLNADRPVPDTARRALCDGTTKKAVWNITYPRRDDFAAIFPELMNSTAMILIEATGGRLVFQVPTKKS